VWQKTQGKSEQGLLHLREMEGGINLEVSVVQHTVSYGHLTPEQLIQCLGSDLGFNFSVTRNILYGLPKPLTAT